MNKLPTKEQIKTKYNITEDDFEILTSLSTKDIIKKKYDKLIKLSSIFGLNPWMLKSITGVVVAVIFVAPKVQPTIDDTVEFWLPKARYTYNAGKKILNNMQKPKEGEEIKTIAILPPKLEFRNTTDKQKTDEFPVGTQVHLISESMILG